MLKETLMRFWSKVNKTETCWEWTGTLNKDGYGTFPLKGKLIKAHRFSYLIEHGDLGKLCVLHKCDNRKCVRPDHLFLNTMSDLDRFWSKVKKTENCWEWTGALNRKGYGMFGYSKEMVLAHRFSYSIANSSPGNLCVLHKCDNPKCVNPEHLFLGTRTENNADCSEKSRVVKGSQTGSAKLTEGKVLIIRERFSQGGITQAALAEEYGVSQQTISCLIARTTWKHV